MNNTTIKASSLSSRIVETNQEESLVEGSGIYKSESSQDKSVNKKKTVLIENDNFGDIEERDGDYLEGEKEEKLDNKIEINNTSENIISNKQESTNDKKVTIKNEKLEDNQYQSIEKEEGVLINKSNTVKIKDNEDLNEKQKSAISELNKQETPKKDDSDFVNASKLSKSAKSIDVKTESNHNENIVKESESNLKIKEDEIILSNKDNDIKESETDNIEKDKEDIEGSKDVNKEVINEQ